MRLERVSLAVALALCLCLQACKPTTQAQAPASGRALFTGREPIRKVRIFFPALHKAGLVEEGAEIYATSSMLNQAKQVVLLVMRGPQNPKSEGAPSFGAGAGMREMFLEGKDLAVVDLTADTVRSHPGGTTAEYASLLSLWKSLSVNIPQAKRLQILIEGQPVESLAGHVDLLDPLGASDF